MRFICLKGIRMPTTESTPAEVRKAEGDFRAELNFIRRSYDAADVVLFPVDRRLGEDYMRGPRQFIETIRTGMFVPMHFGEDYEGGNAFRPIAEERGCRFCAIGHRGERFDLSVGGQTKTVSTI